MASKLVIVLILFGLLFLAFAILFEIADMPISQHYYVSVSQAIGISTK